MVQNHEKRVVKERKEKRERKWKKREAKRRGEISFKVGGEAPKEGKRKQIKEIGLQYKIQQRFKKMRVNE